MTILLQTLATGLAIGSVYTLLAVGFVMIYKATRVINFAHPSLMLVGATTTALLTVQLSVPFFVSVLASVAVVALLAAVIERLAVRPMIGKSVFAIVLATIGLDVAVRVVAGRWIGNAVRPIRDPWGLDTVAMGGVIVQQRHIATFFVMVLCVGALYLFFQHSRFGLAMRATALDQEAAAVQGISVGRVFAVSWLIAGALAAVAGSFASSGVGVDQQTWLIALKALPAVIIGGLDSIQGALVGGLTVGIVEAVVAVYQPGAIPVLGQSFALVAPYVAMFLVLLVRPFGIWGTREVERV
ncbi:branched-chain amino acid ABC transporter permease [Nocardioides sp.]|uniref:branched-chain amino acid ABC transporter permease n=1 Tax=Nocardioides sp. TaxID=35761 RepID=UPI0019AD52C0|nr:branched-chain amino acid ABC transporter permease [Nocardioides sp.]MBC7278232.1 branched-chain amino acid ABC transporter permease [Nocardioides sp.]